MWCICAKKVHVHNKPVPRGKKRRFSISSINRRPGLSGEMQLRLIKVTAFKFSFFGWNGLIHTCRLCV
jgi:hypothetical protein